MKVKQLRAVNELKRRGYTVTATINENLLIEKETFWGYYQYDADIGKVNSKFKWLKSILLSIFYFIGFFGGLYWLYQKDKMNKEILALIN